MRTRMAADDVAAPAEIADGGSVEKAARADIVCGDEEIAAPPLRFEGISGQLCADPSIVEGEGWRSVAGLANGDRIEMRSNPGDGHLVRVGVTAREAARFLEPGFDDVVIHEGD